MGGFPVLSEILNKMGIDNSPVRKKAWLLVSKLPFPDRKDENWKHTRLDDFLDIDNLAVYGSDISESDTPDEGNILFSETEQSTVDISVTLSGKIKCVGPKDTVYVENIDNMPTKELEWAFDERIVKYSPDALVRTLFETGVYLRITGGNSEEPITVRINDILDSKVQFSVVDSEDRIKRFFWFLVDLAPGVSVNLIDEGFMSGKTDSSLFRELTVRVGDGASLNYINVNSSNGLFERDRRVFIAERNSRVNSFSVSTGVIHLRSETELVVDGEGLESDIWEAFLSFNNSKRDIVTLQLHNRGFSESNLRVLGAVGKSTIVDFTGTIMVAKDARKTDAYQKASMILLGNNSHAGAVPKLEILADDVKCSHGASIGEIDKDSLFYLMTRGINIKDAKVMALRGFFEVFLSKLSGFSVKDVIETQIENRLKEFVES